MLGGRRPGAGRKPGKSKVTEIKRLFQEHFSDKEVNELMSDLKVLIKKDPDMLKFTLEQIFGKAPQRMEISGDKSNPIVIEVSIQREFDRVYGKE